MSATKRYLEEIGYFETIREEYIQQKHWECLEEEYYATSLSSSALLDVPGNVGPLETPAQ